MIGILLGIELWVAQMTLAPLAEKKFQSLDNCHVFIVAMPQLLL
jgi:hypothetical protein